MSDVQKGASSVPSEGAVDLADTPTAVRLFGGRGGEAEADFAAAFFDVASAAGIEVVAHPFDEDLHKFGAIATLAHTDRVTSPTKAVGVAETAIVLCVFVGLQAARWATSRVCDMVWDRLKPRLARLARESTKVDGSREYHLVTRTVYSSSQVLVEVDARLNGGTSPDDVARLMADLQRNAIDDQTRDCVMKYRVEEGTVSGPFVDQVPRDDKDQAPK